MNGQENRQKVLGLILAATSVIAAIASLFAGRLQTQILLGGFIGIALSAVWLRARTYMERIDSHEKRIRELEQSWSQQEEINTLKTDVAVMKDRLNRKGNIDAASTLVIIFIIVLILLILAGFGVISLGS